MSQLRGERLGFTQGHGCPIRGVCEYLAPLGVRGCEPSGGIGPSGRTDRVGVGFRAGERRFLEDVHGHLGLESAWGGTILIRQLA